MVQYRTFGGESIYPLVNDKVYYVVYINSDSFGVATSLYHAKNKSTINLLYYGTGEHKFSVINELDDALINPQDGFNIDKYWDGV